MFDSETGGGYDGLTPSGPNLNQVSRVDDCDVDSSATFGTILPLGEGRSSLHALGNNLENPGGESPGFVGCPAKIVNLWSPRSVLGWRSSTIGNTLKFNLFLMFERCRKASNGQGEQLAPSIKTSWRRSVFRLQRTNQKQGSGSLGCITAYFN
jgi:hypothetical protein